MTVNISNFSEPVVVNRLRSTRRDFAQHFIFGEMLIYFQLFSFRIVEQAWGGGFKLF